MWLPAVAVTAGGALAWDRRWAIADAAGHWVNGKHCDRVHRLQATYDLAAETVTLALRGSDRAETFSLQDTSRDRADLERWLGEFFGFPVTICTDPRQGFPDDPHAFGPTIVGTATLAAVASWFPGMTAADARARFRANLEIDGVPAFWEDCLYGATESRYFSLGEVTVEGVTPCLRCVVPTRDPHTGEPWPHFQATFSRQRLASLPPWAAPERFRTAYRLAVNTRIPPTAAGKVLRVGDRLCLARSSILSFFTMQQAAPFAWERAYPWGRLMAAKSNTSASSPASMRPRSRTICRRDLPVASDSLAMSAQTK